ARYKYEADAQRAVDALNDRWYDGKPLFAELSPVTDFQEACCRQNETNECNRGGFCNFMHLRYASRQIRKELNHQLAVELRKRRDEGRDTAKGVKKRLGWKERLALEQGESLADGSDGTVSEDADRHEAKRDWRSGKSGGDWRSQPRASELDAGDLPEERSNAAAHSVDAEAEERSRDGT
ncbi:hypothetical protein, partial [Sporisorium scitamineum]